MTYTVATLPIPSQSHAWIKKKLEAAGYQHAIDGDRLDMTHIALTRINSFPFAGNEDASLMDVALYISEIAFKAGYDTRAELKVGYVGPDQRENAWSNWEPSEQMKDHLVEGFESLRDEVSANLEAQTEEARSIIHRAAELLKIENIPDESLTDQYHAVLNEMRRRNLLRDPVKVQDPQAE